MLIVVYNHLMQTFATHTGEMQAPKFWQAGPASSKNYSLTAFPYCPYVDFPLPFPSPPRWIPRMPAALLLPRQGPYVP